MSLLLVMKKRTKMASSMSCITVLLAVLLTITDGLSMGGAGADTRCRCIQTESKRIGRYIESLQVIEPTSHCPETEIIATLKQSRREVCLDTSAPWVKRILNRYLNRKKP